MQDLGFQFLVHFPIKSGSISPDIGPVSLPS